MLTTASIAACHDKACAPPPVRTGGSRLVKNKSIPNVESSPFSVQSSVIFECLGKACAPPPVGTGGSISSSPATQRAAARYQKARKGGDVIAINKAAVAYGKARARDARAAAPADAKKRVAVAKRHLGYVLKHTTAGPPTEKGRQKLIIDPKVKHLLLTEKVGTPSKTTGKSEPMSTDDIAAAFRKAHNFGELQGTQSILNSSGASAGKPRLVSRDEFGKLKAESSPEATMARSAPEKDHEQLRTSGLYKLRAGGAHYGEGIYFATGKGAAAHVEMNYSAGGRNKTQEAVVDRSAIADYAFISRVQTAVQDGLRLWGGSGMDPKTPKKIREAAEIIIAGAKASGLGKKMGDRGLLFDSSAITVMLGYKGFEVKNPRSTQGKYAGSYISILDRSALTVAK